MKNKKILAPSILSADFTNLSQQIRSVEIGGADWIHCDIMDGHFVPNLTFGPIIVNAVRRITKLTLDVHLMIENSNHLIKNFIEAGANYITVHQEESVHLHRSIAKIKELGAKAGVAINPATPVNTLLEILPEADMVLVMSVNPGFGGQRFISSAINKIYELNRIRSEKDYYFLIQADGGIGKDNIQKISAAGCDVFVVGWSIFSNENITAATVELKNILLAN